MTTDKPQKPLWRRLALPLLGGAVAGFLAATAFLNFVDVDGGSGLGPSREIAGLVGVIYALTGASVLAGTLSPGLGAKFLNVEDADELREQRQMLSFSGVAMVLLGAALVLLAIAGEGGLVSTQVGAIGAIAFVLIATWLSFRSRRHIDELQRALSGDATTTAFYLVFFVGGSWAMLAHLDYLAGPAPLDWLTLFAASVLIASFWQTGRRGLLLRGPN